MLTPCRVALCALLAVVASGFAPAQNHAVLSPSPDGVANEPLPLVRWTPVAGATSYRMQLFADAGFTTLLDELIVRGASEGRFRRSLADDTVYRLAITARNMTSKPLRTMTSRFKTLLRPAWMPPWDIVLDDPTTRQRGYRLLNLLDVLAPLGVRRIPAMLLVNDAGEMVWWYEHPFDGIIESAKALPNGNLLFLANQIGLHPTFGHAYEMTWQRRIVWRSRDGVVPHHEVGIGPHGHYLYLKWVWGIHNGRVLEGDGIELVDPDSDGQPLWQWNIFDHFPPASWPTPESQNPGISGIGGDWSHSNAVVWDPRRKLIWLSVRHFHNVVGIEYPSGKVAVILGQGGLGGIGLMSYQHAPEIQPDGTMLLYDNGNAYTPPFTRVTRLAFDPQARTVNIVWEWRDRPDFFDYAVGDADRLPNGNVLVTAGISNRIIEVTPAGDKAWELRMQGGGRWWYYRAMHVPTTWIDPRILPFGNGD